MSRVEGAQPAPTRQRELPPARPQAGRAAEGELSEEAIRAIEEGRADHDAGRTFTIAEIKRELGIDS